MNDLLKLNSIDEHPRMVEAIRANQRARTQHTQALVELEKARDVLSQTETANADSLIEGRRPASGALEKAREGLAMAESHLRMSVKVADRTSERVKEIKAQLRKEISAVLQPEYKKAIGEFKKSLEESKKKNRLVLDVVLASERLTPQIKFGNVKDDGVRPLPDVSWPQFTGYGAGSRFEEWLRFVKSSQLL